MKVNGRRGGGGGRRGGGGGRSGAPGRGGVGKRRSERLLRFRPSCSLPSVLLLDLFLPPSPSTFRAAGKQAEGRRRQAEAAEGEVMDADGRVRDHVRRGREGRGGGGERRRRGRWEAEDEEGEGA